MFNSFTNVADLTPFKLEAAQINLEVKNDALAYGADRSMLMDFTEYDRIDDFELNEILWHSIMAHAQEADYIEQDVVLSKDGEFVVTHDITMEETTNVEQRFPDRARSDGRFYFADFAWSEIQQLSMHERVRRGSDQPALPHRFPNNAGQRALKLSDEIRLIAGLNETTGKQTGLYIELKSPAFHKKEFGYPMGESLLKVLETLGIQSESDRCFIQCFEMDELKDLHERLRCKLPLIQLLGKRPSDAELKSIALYSKGIGPSLELLASRNENNEIVSTGLVEAARQSGRELD